MPNTTEKRHNEPLDLFCDCGDIYCPGCNLDTEPRAIIPLDPYLAAIRSGGARALFQR